MSNCEKNMKKCEKNIKNIDITAFGLEGIALEEEADVLRKLEKCFL